MSNSRIVMAHGKRIVVETLETSPAPKKREAKRPEEFFAKVPLQWAAAAAECTDTRRAMVWILLQFEAFRADSNTFRFGNVILARFGINRELKRQILAMLEAAGLIKIKRKPGCAVVITLIAPVTQNDAVRG